jgi:hypothetical protein
MVAASAQITQYIGIATLGRIEASYEDTVLWDLDVDRGSA